MSEKLLRSSSVNLKWISCAIRQKFYFYYIFERTIRSLKLWVNFEWKMSKKFFYSKFAWKIHSKPVMVYSNRVKLEWKFYDKICLLASLENVKIIRHNLILTRRICSISFRLDSWWVRVYTKIKCSNSYTYVSCVSCMGRSKNHVNFPVYFT